MASRTDSFPRPPATRQAPVTETLHGVQITDPFRWLYAYSPYHHVQKDVHHPSVLFHTAESDSRVDPLHARKMAALMQNAVQDKSLVFLRLEARAGHGIGKPVNKVIAEQVDTWGFLAWQRGLR